MRDEEIERRFDAIDRRIDKISAEEFSTSASYYTLLRQLLLLADYLGLELVEPDWSIRKKETKS